MSAISRSHDPFLPSYHSIWANVLENTPIILPDSTNHVAINQYRRIPKLVVFRFAKTRTGYSLEIVDRTIFHFSHREFLQSRKQTS